jgi:uncharacterized protein YcfJ
MRRPPPRPFRPPACAGALLLAAVLAAPAAAQQPDRRGISEDVRFDHAQVMRVQPVYETLTATRMEERCRTPGGIVVIEPQGAERGRFARFVEAVRDALGSDGGQPRSVPARPADASGCEMVQVEREFRRPVAYDVDYVYKGAKYRSRLPEDPGNRLRVRVSVTPVVAPATER